MGLKLNLFACRKIWKRPHRNDPIVRVELRRVVAIVDCKKNNSLVRIR